MSQSRSLRDSHLTFMCINLGRLPHNLLTLSRPPLVQLGFRDYIFLFENFYKLRTY